MKINAEPSYPFFTSIASGVDDIEKRLGFVWREKGRIEKFGDPIHLVCIGQVKGDLNIFVGVFNEDEGVIINVCGLPSTFEEDRAALLHLGGAKTSAFEMPHNIIIRQQLRRCGVNRFSWLGASEARGGEQKEQTS